MVDKTEENNDIDVEVTTEDAAVEDMEIEDIEEKSGDKLKQLRTKLKTAESDKMSALEDLQRAKAEFLNAKKRLEEEKAQDRLRAKLAHAEELLPLCDSFQMAMGNTEVWEKADEAWRKGIEGIHMQLQKLLQSYNVVKIDALNASFDPHRHEAMDTVAVTDEKEVDVVKQVLQEGYEMQTGETTEVIRPARVVTGSLEKKQD